MKNDNDNNLPLVITNITGVLVPLQFQAERTNNAVFILLTPMISVELVVFKSSNTDAFSTDKPSRTW